MRFARAVLFWAHLAVGCVAGLVILAMSVTGVLLAFERQINAVADAPAVLQGQSDSEEPASLDLLMARLKSDGQGEPSELVLHNNSNAPVEARFGRERTLYLNPWTGEVVGQPSEATRAFFGAVERIHRSLGLGMQSAFGRGMTGAANLAFLFHASFGPLSLAAEGVQAHEPEKPHSVWAQPAGQGAGMELASRIRDLDRGPALLHRFHGRDYVLSLGVEPALHDDGHTGACRRRARRSRPARHGIGSKDAARRSFCAGLSHIGRSHSDREATSFGMEVDGGGSSACRRENARSLGGQEHGRGAGTGIAACAQS